MTSPRSKTQAQHANAIYEALIRAFGAGYHLEVDEYGFLDLVDKDGHREVLTAARVRESE